MIEFRNSRKVSLAKELAIERLEKRDKLLAIDRANSPPGLPKLHICQGCNDRLTTAEYYCWSCERAKTNGHEIHESGMLGHSEICNCRDLKLFRSVESQLEKMRLAVNKIPPPTPDKAVARCFDLEVGR
jgi:hypothetical protein